MKREEVIGVKLECIGTDEFCESEFIIGEAYAIEDDPVQNFPVLIAEDGFDWSVFPENYTDLNDMIIQLNRSTTGKFKLADGGENNAI